MATEEMDLSSGEIMQDTGGYTNISMDRIGKESSDASQVQETGTPELDPVANEDPNIEPASETKRRKLNEEQEVSTQEGGWWPNTVTCIQDKLRFSSNTYHTEIPQKIQENPNSNIVLGVDEAGRGPVLGPMVYGVSYCLESYQSELKRYGFADSKVLKDHVRSDLFQKLHDATHELYQNVGWAACTMTAKDISNGMLRSVLGAGAYNLNEQAHDTTIQLIKEILAKGVHVTSIFVDTVGPPASYQAKLRRFFPGIDIVVTKKADSIYPIVSTASVVAKVTRDMNLKWYGETLDLLKGHQLGSGYPSDPNTSKWLHGHVDKVFGWFFGLVRFSWQTAKDSLLKNGAVHVIYEDQCVGEKGYRDIGAQMAKSEFLVDSSFYGRPVEV